MQAKIQMVKDKVAQCFALAESKFGITMPPVNLRFDLTGRAAGMAGYKSIRGRGAFDFYLRFNTTHMKLGGQTWEHIIANTVAHECAHTVCQAFPKFGRSHDSGWKAVCKALGGNGNRCYGKDDAPEAIALQLPFTYTTTSGATVSVSKVIHSKIQQGGVYNAKQGGQLTRACAYNTTMPTTSQSVPPKTLPPKTLPPKTTLSKADMIRAFIINAKADYGSEAFEKAVRYGIEGLGMTAALSRTYVKNNYNKV